MRDVSYIERLVDVLAFISVSGELQPLTLVAMHAHVNISSTTYSMHLIVYHILYMHTYMYTNIYNWYTGFSEAKAERKELGETTNFIVFWSVPAC